MGTLTQGMLYLAHISVASLPEGVRQALAVDLALAALLGDTARAPPSPHPSLRLLSGRLALHAAADSAVARE